MRRLLLDVDSGDLRLRDELRAAGWQVERAADLGSDEVDDAALLQFAAELEYTVHTVNRVDFARLTTQWARDGKSHAGVIIRRPQQASAEMQLAALSSKIERGPQIGPTWSFGFAPARRQPARIPTYSDALSTPPR